MDTRRDGRQARQTRLATDRKGKAKHRKSSKLARPAERRGSQRRKRADSMEGSKSWHRRRMKAFDYTFRQFESTTIPGSYLKDRRDKGKSRERHVAFHLFPFLLFTPPQTNRSKSHGAEEVHGESNLYLGSLSKTFRLNSSPTRSS